MPRKVKKKRVTKKTVSRRKRTVSRRKKTANKKESSILKKGIATLFFSVIIILLLTLATYFFVLPSVIFNDDISKNILIVTDNLDEDNKYISLAHLSNNSDENVIIFFNGEQTVDTGDGYGEYRLNTIYPLLKIDKQTDQKIKSVFSKMLKITIDEIVIVDGVDEKMLENRQLKHQLISNAINGSKDSFKNKINLLKLHFLANTMEIIEMDEIDRIEKIYYKLSTIDEGLSKNCSVSVVNATPTEGQAFDASEIIENTGAQVVQVEGSDSTLEKTMIYFPSKKLECKVLVEKLMGIFSNRIEARPNYELPKTQKLRSDIIIMLGDDY